MIVALCCIFVCLLILTPGYFANKQVQLRFVGPLCYAMFLPMIFMIFGQEEQLQQEVHLKKLKKMRQSMGEFDDPRPAWSPASRTIPYGR